MLELFRIVFDRRHVKDLRLWTILMIFIGFSVYHWQIIRPMQERLERHGKRIRGIIKVAHLSEKMDALDPSNGLP